MPNPESPIAEPTEETRPARLAANTTGKKKKGRWLIWLAVLCLIGAGAYLIFPRASEGQSNRSKSGRAKGSQTISVVAAKVHRGNLPIYLTGLGTITAFNTVTVRTRVDGELVKVAFTEGQYVKQGDLLAIVDPRPFQVQLEQAEGQMAGHQAQLQNARLDLERYKILFGQDSIPKQTLDTQAAMVNQVEGVIKTDQAQIDNAKLQLVYTRITAPITGRIGLRLVDQGNMVHANDTNGLVVITQLQPIACIFNIAEDDLPQVMKAMRRNPSLPVEAYDRDLKTRLAKGSLLTIDNQIDQSSGTVKFKAEFRNEDNSLFPNQFVNARLLVDTMRNAVLTPAAAIQRGPESSYVYVIKPGNTVDVRDVEVAAIQGDQAAIRSGIAPGDLVVTDGVDKLQKGSKVAVRMAEPGVGASAKGAASEAAE